MRIKDIEFLNIIALISCLYLVLYFGEREMVVQLALMGMITILFGHYVPLIKKERDAKGRSSE